MLRAVLAFLMLTLLPACASLGLQTAETFNQRAAYTLAGITAAREATTAALEAGTITADDAAHVQALANRAREGVDAARRLRALDGTGDAALDRLRLAEGVLAELSAYLQRRGTP